MSLGFGSNDGGSNDLDTATISYNDAPSIRAGLAWVKLSSAIGHETNILDAYPAFAWRFGLDTSTFERQVLSRDFSVTDMQRYFGFGDGTKTAPLDTWIPILFTHDGTTADPVFYSQTNTYSPTAGTAPSGSLVTGMGTIKIGFGAEGLAARMQLAELALFDYVPGSTDISALLAGGSPMALATPPVWYNRMRTDGTGDDAQVGSITSVSGAVYNSGDNPTVDDPASSSPTQILRPIADIATGSWKVTANVQPSTAIDPEPNFPVNAGVAFCYNPGGYAGDLVSNTAFTHNDGSLVSTTVGQGNQIPANGVAYWSYPIGPILGVGDPYTVTIFADATSAIYLFSNYVITGTGLALKVTAGNLHASIASSGFGADIDLGVTVVSGTMYAITARYNGTTFDFFVAGIGVVSGATAPGTHAFSGGDITLNQLNSAGANSSSCTIPFVHIVPFAMTDAQIEGIHSNPWKVFSSSTDVYQAIDETTADATDFAFVLLPGVPYWFKFGAGTMPLSLTGSVLNIRGLSPQLRSLQVDIYQGYLGTLIATRTINLTATDAQSDLSLTDPELANVTDLSDIHGRMVGL